MKKKAIYRKKLTRAIKSSFKEIDSLPALTVVDACKRIREISYRKAKD